MYSATMPLIYLFDIWFNSSIELINGNNYNNFTSQHLKVQVQDLILILYFCLSYCLIKLVRTLHGFKNVMTKYICIKIINSCLLFTVALRF